VSAVLETRALTRRFGGVKAVSDVSFSIGEGTVLGVIGPNGAGKSTLINLITGHVRPTGGRVMIDGRDVTGQRPWTIARSRVARTFQIVKPFRNLSVRENVAIGAMFGSDRARSAREALDRAAEALERVGLAERAEASPSELSVADARRLELAKALAMRPRLLLLDEVMAGLRPGEIRPALELIRSLRPELVVLGLMLPGKDGLGVLAEIRGDPALRHSPVVLVTAWSHYRSAALDAGADRFVSKPFDPEELRAMVEELLGGRVAPSRVDRPDQTDVRAEPTRPEGGADKRRLEGR
jgi:branched-chain amino acid transport system ATP-binding protein